MRDQLVVALADVTPYRGLDRQATSVAVPLPDVALFLADRFDALYRATLTDLVLTAVADPEGLFDNALQMAYGHDRVYIASDDTLLKVELSHLPLTIEAFWEPARSTTWQGVTVLGEHVYAVDAVTFGLKGLYRIDRDGTAEEMLIDLSEFGDAETVIAHDGYLYLMDRIASQVNVPSGATLPLGYSLKSAVFQVDPTDGSYTSFAVWETPPASYLSFFAWGMVFTPDGRFWATDFSEHLWEFNALGEMTAEHVYVDDFDIQLGSLSWSPSMQALIISDASSGKVLAFDPDEATFILLAEFASIDVSGQFEGSILVGGTAPRGTSTEGGRNVRVRSYSEVE